MFGLCGKYELLIGKNCEGLRGREMKNKLVGRLMKINSLEFRLGNRF